MEDFAQAWGNLNWVVISWGFIGAHEVKFKMVLIGDKDYILNYSNITRFSIHLG